LKAGSRGRGSRRDESRKKFKSFSKNLLRRNWFAVYFLNVLCEFSSGSDLKIFAEKTKIGVAVRFQLDKVFPLLQSNPAEKNKTKLLTVGAIGIN